MTANSEVWDISTQNHHLRLVRDLLSNQITRFVDSIGGSQLTPKAIVWLDLASTMHTLGFAAEHRGGSTFTFKGAIRLPNDPLAPQKRSISVHMPHPSPETSPISLQSLGRRCNRRFGWVRANFATEGGDIAQVG